MEIPYSKKASMNIRTWMRSEVPWIFGKFIMDKDTVTVKFFVFSKKFRYNQITSVKLIDSYLEIRSDKDTFQIRLPNSEEVKDHIEKQSNKKD